MAKRDYENWYTLKFKKRKAKQWRLMLRSRSIETVTQEAAQLLEEGACIRIDPDKGSMLVNTL